jgi:hypothetical protein
MLSGWRGAARPPVLAVPHDSPGLSGDFVANATAATMAGVRARSWQSQGSFSRTFERNIAATAPPRRASAGECHCRAWGRHPGRVLPPVEFCRGNSQIHAAQSPPDRKIDGSESVAVICEAMIRRACLQPSSPRSTCGSPRLRPRSSRAPDRVPSRVVSQ